MDERMRYVEKLLGDSADKHAKELKALKAAHEKHAGDTSRDMADLKALSTHHASIPERMDYLESLLGDSADKHSKELAQLKDAHGKHAQDLQALKGIHSTHATMGQRIDYLEKMLGDSADKHQAELK